MRIAEKKRLMMKFRVRECGGGQWGNGFLEGLSASEGYLKRPKVKRDDINVPLP